MFVIPKTKMTMIHFIGLLAQDHYECSGRVLHASFRRKRCAESYYFTVLAHKKGLAVVSIKGCFYWLVNQTEEQYFTVRARSDDLEVEVLYIVRNGEIVEQHPRFHVVA